MSIALAQALNDACSVVFWGRAVKYLEITLLPFSPSRDGMSNSYRDTAEMGVYCLKYNQSRNAGGVLGRGRRKSQVSLQWSGLEGGSADDKAGDFHHPKLKTHSSVFHFGRKLLLAQACSVGLQPVLLHSSFPLCVYIPLGSPHLAKTFAS